MGERTSIAWTDSTWNPVRGCSRVSPGCQHCYAERVAARFIVKDIQDNGDGSRTALAGPFYGFAKSSPHGPRWTGTVALVEDHLLDPLRWRKPRRIFVNSMSDLFHEALPDEAIDRVFAVMALAPRHTFQILTKRAERMRAWFAAIGGTSRADWVVSQMHRIRDRLPGRLRDATLTSFSAWPLPNVWLGVSCEDQQRADERIPFLLQTPAAVRFVSAEPLLGPVNFEEWIAHSSTTRAYRHEVRTGHRCGPLEFGKGDRLDCTACIECKPSITNAAVHPDWVIVGGESGPGARPCHEDWIASILRQCHDAVVPAFCKQVGAHVLVRNDSYTDRWNAASVALDERYEPDHQGEAMRIYPRDPRGGDPAEWPEDLRVREFPR